jgi:hypothetical protein
VAILIVAMSWVKQHVRAESKSLAASVENAQFAEKDAAAKDMLMRMVEFLSKTAQFSVNLKASYDVHQESGQMIEFGEIRKIIASRPNRLRVEMDQSNGEKQLFQYDGKEITVFSPSQNVYAQASKPGGIDEAVMYFL